MHELSVAQSICEAVIARAPGARVEEMVVEVGALSGVNAESLEFVMPNAAEICGLELGAFSIRPVPARAACECGHEYDATQILEPCPQCSGFDRSITGGEDVVVSRLIVVEDNEQTD